MKWFSWCKKHPILSFLILGAIVSLSLGISTRSHKTKAISFSDPLKKGSMMECVYGVGTVASDHTFQVKSGIPSKVHSLYVKEGDFVEEGTKLLELETLFIAPFPGVVTSISIAPGEIAFPGNSLLQLVDLRHRHILVTLDQTGALRVEKGQKVGLNFDGLREKTLEGKVSAIYPVDHRFLVRIDVEDLPSQILPGMNADVAIEIAEHSNVFVVPISALNKNRVKIQRKEQKPFFVTIQLGLINKTMAEVISEELQEGDILLLQNKEKP